VYHETIDPDSVIIISGKQGKQRQKRLDMPKYQLYMNESSFMDLTNFAALCKGEQLQVIIEITINIISSF
jgi:hypothetical protein